MTKPNAIEKIMAEPVKEILATVVHPDLAEKVAIEVVERQGAALDAAGLAVVPKAAQHTQALCAQSSVPLDDCKAVYQAMVYAFDPTTWTPKP